MEGRAIGETTEEQTRATLGNYAGQPGSADRQLSDVFKVHIYLTDLGNWSRFNVAYERIIPQPFPVRTTVQAVLLPGFLVEIEMWAAKNEGLVSWYRSNSEISPSPSAR